MISRPIILVLLSLNLTASLSAQTTVGVEGGLGYNTYHTNISNRPASGLAGEVGCSFSLPLRYQLSSWLYVLTTPGLVQKGYSMDRIDSLSGEYDQHINTYIQLPVGAGFSHDWGRLRAAIDLGVYAAYWLYGRQKGNTADIFGNAGANDTQQFNLIAYDGPWSFDPRRDNRWEAGWWLGPSLQYRFTGSGWVTAGAKYFGALTSQTRAPESPAASYNRTWTFSLGAAWSLNHSKSGHR
jgi:hypothetical protein